MRLFILTLFIGLTFVLSLFSFDPFSMAITQGNNFQTNNISFDLQDAGDRETLVFINHAVSVLNFPDMKNNVLPIYYDIETTFSDDLIDGVKWHRYDGSVVVAEINIDDQMVVIIFPDGQKAFAKINPNETVTVTLPNNSILTYKIMPDGNFYLESPTGDVMKTSLYQEKIVTTNYSNGVIITKLFENKTITTLFDDTEILISSDVVMIKHLDSTAYVELTEGDEITLSDDVVVTVDDAIVTVNSPEYSLIAEVFYGGIRVDSMDVISIGLSDNTMINNVDNTLHPISLNDHAEFFTSHNDDKIIKSIDGTISKSTEGQITTTLSDSIVNTTLSDGTQFIDRTYSNEIKQIFEYDIDGNVVIFSALDSQENPKARLLQPDGTAILKSNDGLIHVISPDNTVYVGSETDNFQVYSDTVITTVPDGTIHVSIDDNRSIIRENDGSTSIIINSVSTSTGTPSVSTSTGTPSTLRSYSNPDVKEAFTNDGILDTGDNVLPSKYRSNLEDNKNGSDISDPMLEQWLKENYNDLNLMIAQGDPNIFTLDDSIEPCTIKMHPDQDDSYHWKFDLFVTDIPLRMDRTLCDGTYMMFIDFNSNGILDDGYEALWHPDYTTYEIMHIIDYEKGDNHDGKINADDTNIWNNVLVMDSDYKVHIPSKIGITGFDYIQEIGLGNDHYGPGIYSDCLYEGKNLYPNCKPISDTHFRVISWNPQGIQFDDGTTKPTYGAMQGPLLDCTIYDARYMIAEKQLSEWNLDEAMRLYEEGLEYCESMDFTSEDPDKLLSHWVAGKASYYHRDGQIEEAKPLYEEALEMSPDRHFYLTDYALLLDQLGFDADATLPIVERALEIDPDHGYAHTVKDRILSKQ